ncbi:MAG: carboxylesterase family protein, partial [Bacteroidetes bacterium]|nr:carboxylesterase family protein [Bacteroidota bacterium]
MNPKYIFILFLIFIIGCSSANAQQKILYKQIGDTKLYMEIYNSESMDSAKKYPVIVFYFGGGWSSGSTSQFEPHAKYFTQRGMVCVLVDYRVKDRQQT